MPAAAAPLPARIARDARFWDRAAPSYARSAISDEATYREKLRLTQAALRPDMRVLELGCGTGSTALEHAHHVAHIDATDVSPAMIEIARARAAEAGVANVAFRAAALEAVAPAEPYDAVLALNLLHLVRDRPAALARIRAMLKPGGLFVGSTACLGDFIPWFRVVIPLGRAIGKLPHVEVFTEEAHLAELAAAGLAVETRLRPKRSAALFTLARAV